MADPGAVKRGLGYFSFSVSKTLARDADLLSRSLFQLCFFFFWKGRLK